MTTQAAVQSISAQEAKAKLNAGAVAVDVAPAPDWAGAHVPGSMNLPLLAIRSRKSEVPADKAVVFFSEDGLRAADAAAVAATLGFAEVYAVEGGTRAWMRAGFETEALM
jgi:rhodanese-related sulfurtransferase